jgi:DNA-binding NarL/FixJ family response regulator
MHSNRKTRVVIVDDHPLVRERLAHLISQDTEMCICGEADNVRQGRQIIEATQPDIVVLDITLKGSSGLELIKDLKAAGLSVPVIVLSMHDEALYAERAFRAGARGYITKSEASEDIMQAIRCVLDGKVYASEKFTAEVLTNFADAGRPRKASPLNELTDRELEVFYLIGQGRSTQEIAMSLNLGSRTVDTYKTRIKEALNLKNAPELYNRAAIWVRDIDAQKADSESGSVPPAKGM